jgi:hypothetical protein
LLGRLTKLVVESALEGEMDDHLDYERHDPAGRNGENSRNGKRAKSVLAGPVRWGSRCRGIGIPRSSRRSSPSGSDAYPGLAALLAAVSHLAGHRADDRRS